MKITKSQLKQIIKEELQKTLEEAGPSFRTGIPSKYIFYYKPGKPAVDYHEIGVQDAGNGLAKYYSIPKDEEGKYLWQFEGSEGEYDEGYEEGTEMTSDVRGIVGAVTDSDWYSDEFETLADRKYADR